MMISFGGPGVSVPSFCRRYPRIRLSTVCELNNFPFARTCANFKAVHLDRSGHSADYRPTIHFRVQFKPKLNSSLSLNNPNCHTNRVDLLFRSEPLKKVSGWNFQIYDYQVPRALCMLRLLRSKPWSSTAIYAPNKIHVAPHCSFHEAA
jgi:hypothetical protein